LEVRGEGYLDESAGRGLFGEDEQLRLCTTIVAINN